MLRAAPGESLLLGVRTAVVSLLIPVRDVLVAVLAGDKADVPLMETLPVLVLGEVVVVESFLEVGLFAAPSTALRVVMGLLRMGETPGLVVVLRVVLSCTG
jgi:hypothetical protein